MVIKVSRFSQKAIGSVLLISLLVMTTMDTSNAQEVSKESIHANIKKGIGLSGYDPVAYFVDSKAIKGSQKITVTHDGIIYYFSSEDHKKLFLKIAEQYIPTYGGWCAYAMGLDGSKVKIDPKTFKIIDGKLYLFYNFYLTNTLKDWNKNEKELLEKADRYWKELIVE